MKHPESSIVIKYFDLIDEFIKVRSCTDEIMSELARSPIANKATYRRNIVETCIPDFESEIRSALKRLEDDYEGEIVEELLYQICIDVNPALEIHQVSLPTNGQNADGEPLLTPMAANSDRQGLYRKVLGLEKALKTQIVGQDDAITTLVRSIKKAAVGLKRPTTPIGTFFLVGRTGTGKTELAKAVARTLYDDPGRLIRVDCSEYALPHEYAKLIGSPPGYIGHSEGGFLTEAVKKRKNCVVLFDEIEKAHSKVHNLLLQLLDEGVLTDSKGQVVSFAKTIVILTSNLGVEKIDAIRGRMGFRRPDDKAWEEMDLKTATLEAFKEAFRPEFINRIDETVVFNPLDVKVCARIANRMLREVADLLSKHGIKVEFSPAVRHALAREGFSEEYGARELRRLIKRKIEDPLTELILGEDLGTGSKVVVKMRDGEPQLIVADSEPSELINA